MPGWFLLSTVNLLKLNVNNSISIEVKIIDYIKESSHQLMCS